MFSKLIVNSAWYYFLISILLSAAIGAWLYYKNKKNTDVSRRILLLMSALRFFSLFIISILLLAIFFKRTVNETENPLIIVALDNSGSMMASKDSDYVQTQFLMDLQEFKKKTAEKYQVRSVLFGSMSQSTEKAPTFSEKETDLADLFQSLDNNYSNQNIGALVLISDGIYNKGANPLFASEKLNYPVYTMAMGDTSEFRDLAIQKINHNQLSYSGNNFPVEVIIQAKKFAGEQVKLSIYEGGVLKTQDKFSIPSDNFLSTRSFTLAAGKTGLSRYTVKLDLLDGEKNRYNNEQSFVIEVIDSKEKILLLAAGPHPDITAIREALSISGNYELEFSLFKDLRQSVKAYNLIIFHGFNPSQSNLINECKNNLVPYWIINPQSAENLPDIKIAGNGNRFNDAEPSFVKSFGLFNMSLEFQKFAGELPAVKSFFGNYTSTNGVQNLLNQRIGIVETENPLMCFSESGAVKSAYFLGDGLWRWKLRDFSEHKNNDLFTEFVSKSIQYLTVKADKSLFRVNGPKIIEENKAIEFDAEVYNKSYELITEPEVTMVITNSEKQTYNYNFSKTNGSYKLNIGILPVGEYSYEAQVKVNGEITKKQGKLVVKEVITEKINSVANHQLLYQLSKRSNGTLYYANQFEKLEEALLKDESIKPITYTQKSTSALIEFMWLFWIILCLLAAEWYFRKRYLSI